MLIKSIAEVLAPAIRAKCFDPNAMLLSNCPCFEEFVVLEGFVLGGDQVNDCKTSSIIREGDKVLFLLRSCDTRWSPHICVDLIPKAQGRDTDVWLGYRDAGGTREYACFAVTFRHIGIKLDPLDGPDLNKLAGAGNGYMFQAVMQLHDGQELNSMSILRGALILVEATCIACDICNQLSAWRGEPEVSVSNVRHESFFVQCPEGH